MKRVAMKRPYDLNKLVEEFAELQRNTLGYLDKSVAQWTISTEGTDLVFTTENDSLDPQPLEALLNAHDPTIPFKPVIGAANHLSWAMVSGNRSDFLAISESPRPSVLPFSAVTPNSTENAMSLDGQGNITILRDGLYEIELTIAVAILQKQKRVTAENGLYVWMSYNNKPKNYKEAAGETVPMVYIPPRSMPNAGDPYITTARSVASLARGTVIRLNYQTAGNDSLLYQVVRRQLYMRGM